MGIVRTAKVAVENTAYAFDTLFSYKIPDTAADRLSAGMRVVVPFGRGNRKRVGLVFALEDAEDEKRLKYLDLVIDEEPVISGELLKLCVWLRENTFCTYYDAFRAILPPGLGYSLKRNVEICRDFAGELSDDERVFLNALRTADKSTSAALIAGNKRLVDALEAKGAVSSSVTAKRRVGDDSVSMVRVCGEFGEGEKPTAKQKAVVEFLSECEAASVQEVCYNCAVTSAVVKRLIEKGILGQYEQMVFRTRSDEEAVEDPNDIVFSPKQQEVFDGILDLMNLPDPKCALLRGVTGSGKTSVFIRLINEALKQGKSAIMLVPEISLTPQMVGRFRRLFGSRVAIMHSSLSLGERADEYRRIKSGDARIVVGTRSAVFAPVSDLGIIVIDEEGESSYKSESSPRYHARDVAKQRCFAHNSLLLLASATPSLESYYSAKSGRYSLFELDERYSNAALPEVYIVDMQEERRNGNQSTFSVALLDEIKANLDRGEQSILLLNRRGYRTSVRCIACGKPLECPNCALPLTYHRANGCVMCHYCGYFRRLDAVCPSCGGKFFDMKGMGTQLVEDEISEMFPKARILRMDADTTSTKHSFEKSFKAFSDGEYDIMVGTQMIAKGLDFPNVTLVGVLKTDNSLYAADFHAYERTFSLITQVVGRAGRAGKPGRAMIQTFSPEHFVINLAARQDYPAFYGEEIELRRAQFYPPFCDVAAAGFSSVSEERCVGAARKFADMMIENAKQYGSEVPLRILGPAAAHIGKVNGRYRFSLVIKCKNNRFFRSMAETTLKQAYSDKDFTDVAFYLDINGDPE